MTVLEAFILALIQGLTEFLPVSSSGHLVITQELLNLHNPELITFDVFVHFGTLISVSLIFWKDIVSILSSTLNVCKSFTFKQSYDNSEHFRLAVTLFIATIPAVIIGLTFKDKIENAFLDPKLVSVNLVITGLILFLTRLAKPTGNKKVGIVSSVVIGCAQSFAILPGISRSGSTISSALYLKISPVQAARFSFLLSLPVIFGAAVLESIKLFKHGTSLGFLPIVTGIIVSAIAGYIAIKFLLKVIEKGKFSWFSVYCLLIGIIGIIFI